MKQLNSRGRRGQIIFNSIWNITGQLSPVIVAIIALPFIIKNIGLERYGLLTLIWILIGYASLFDLGIGRALTRLIAHRLSVGKRDESVMLAKAGLTLLLLSGVASGVLFAAFVPLLATRVLHVDAALVDEAMISLWLVALSMPLVLVTSGYSGVMAAHQRFKPLNLIKVIMGFLTYGAPAVLSFLTPDLSAAVAVLVLMRVLSTIAHAFACRSYCALPLRLALPGRQHSRELLNLGGWITVSNIVGPLLGYMDRFVVASLVPIAMVAYYATSFDLLQRSMVIPYAFAGAVFPLASTLGRGQPATTKLLREMARALLVLMFPITFGFFVLAKPGLTLWLGEDFARQGAAVLQILSIGVLVNIVAQAPATLIQAAGKPRWMAICHVCELPIFVATLWVLTKEYGIVGAAVAAMLRNIIDGLVVLVLATKGLALQGLTRKAWAHGAMVSLLFAGGLWIERDMHAVAYFIVALSVFAAYVWLVMLDRKERRSLLGAAGLRTFSSGVDR